MPSMVSDYHIFLKLSRMTLSNTTQFYKIIENIVHEYLFIIAFFKYPILMKEIIHPTVMPKSLKLKKNNSMHPP